MNLQEMKYLRTTLATDWPSEEPWQVRVFKTILFLIPNANPEYDSKLHLVKKWLVEFVEEEGELVPWREIGLDASGEFVLAGPDYRNYGFWCDTKMTFESFNGEETSKEEFESIWKLTWVQELQID